MKTEKKFRPLGAIEDELAGAKDELQAAEASERIASGKTSKARDNVSRLQAELDQAVGWMKQNAEWNTRWRNERGPVAS